MTNGFVQTEHSYEHVSQHTGLYTLLPLPCLEINNNLCLKTPNQYIRYDVYLTNFFVGGITITTFP
jgi:hypothetical protein